MIHKHVLTAADGDPTTPAEFVAARLGVSRATAKRWVALGAIEVARRRATATTVIGPGARVVVRQPAEADGAGKRPGAATTVVELHRDAALLAVDKPAGMLSQPSPGEAGSALSERYPDAHLLHRLDRETSGVALFTRTPGANTAMQQALASGKLRREYLAIVGGVVATPGEVRLRIARDPRDQRRRVALPEAASGGQAACTRYQPLGPVDLGDGRPATALFVELVTGRTHQIRVHLAAVGHPVAGDRLYGGPEASRLLLHAWRLHLRHPTTGAPLTLCAPPPPPLGNLTDPPR